MYLQMVEGFYHYTSPFVSFGHSKKQIKETAFFFRQGLKGSGCQKKERLPSLKTHPRPSVE
jgi:hypothetical protein